MNLVVPPLANSLRASNGIPRTVDILLASSPTDTVSNQSDALACNASLKSIRCFFPLNEATTTAAMGVFVEFSDARTMH